MRTVQFTTADLNDPFESHYTFIDYEFAADTEDGACPVCFNVPAPKGPLDIESRAEDLADVPVQIAKRDYEHDLSRDAALDMVQMFCRRVPQLEALSKRPHLHLVVSGREPEASPRYYEVRFR